MSALRLARAATGRDKIVKFAGAYHGHVDGLLAEAGSGLATQGIPASPGVTEAQAADTVIVPWNCDPPDVEAAAIICEPYPANMGLVPPRDGYLRGCARYADATGALLIFDEVISGFRVARGGAQEREGVTPDLTVLGKVIGGGLPAAAYAGRRELMEQDRPGGRRLPGGHPVGQPARHGRRARNAATARRARLRQARPLGASPRGRARALPRTRRALRQARSPSRAS